MYDTSKLRSRIVERYDDIGAFSKAVNNSESYVKHYLEGERILTQNVIEKWAAALDISPIDYDDYFFTTVIEGH